MYINIAEQNSPTQKKSPTRHPHYIVQRLMCGIHVVSLKCVLNENCLKKMYTLRYMFACNNMYCNKMFYK